MAPWYITLLLLLDGIIAVLAIALFCALTVQDLIRHLRREIACDPRQIFCRHDSLSPPVVETGRYWTGQIRTAWPPPATRFTFSTVRRSTRWLETSTFFGYTSASGASADLGGTGTPPGNLYLAGPAGPVRRSGALFYGRRLPLAAHVLPQQPGIAQGKSGSIQKIERGTFSGEKKRRNHNWSHLSGQQPDSLLFNQQVSFAPLRIRSVQIRGAAWSWARGSHSCQRPVQR